MTGPPPPPPPPPPGPTTPPPVLAFVVVANTPDTPQIVTVAHLLVEYEADEITLRVTISQELTAPLAEVKTPPLILYSPPTTDIEVGALIHPMVTGFDV